MATNQFLSNYENLFSSYRESISSQNTKEKANIERDIINHKNTIDRLDKELSEIKLFLSHPTKTRPTIDTRKSLEFKSVVKKAEENLKKVKSANTTLSDAARKSVEKSLAFEQQRELQANTLISDLTNQIIDPATPASTLPSLKSKRTRAQNSLKTIHSNLNKYATIIDEDDKKIEKIEVAQQELNNTLAKQQAILNDEEAYRRNAVKENDLIAQDIQAKKEKRKELILEKSRLSKELPELEVALKKVPKSTTGTIDEFKNFLTEKGFSTVHAEELYEFYKNPKYKLPEIKMDEFKIRKQHPVRDFLLKRGGLVALLAGTAFVGGITYLAASNLIAGSIPGITSDMALNNRILGGLSALTGLGVTSAYIGTKNWLTKRHYKKTYGDPQTKLEENDYTQIENLIKTIDNTTDQILDLRTGNQNIFSRFGRAVKRTYLNIINRNRIHHLESITDQLMERFNSVTERNVPDEDKRVSADKLLDNITPIKELLTLIHNFYKKDIKRSQVYTLLNCNDTNKGHSHKIMEENVDIYSKMDMYLNEISKYDELDKKTKNSIYKSVKKDTKTQKVVAKDMINRGEVPSISLVLKACQEYERASDKKKVPADKVVKGFMVDGDGKLHVTFGSGKQEAYEIETSSGIVEVTSVNKGRTLLITYKDGEEASVAVENKTKKHKLNKAGEFTILEKVQQPEVIDYLTQEKGFDKDVVMNFISALRATKLNKNGKLRAKPTEFTKTTPYKENAEYAAIIDEVNDIVNNPNKVNVNSSFNV